MSSRTEELTMLQGIALSNTHEVKVTFDEAVEAACNANSDWTADQAHAALHRCIANGWIAVCDCGDVHMILTPEGKDYVTKQAMKAVGAMIFDMVKEALEEELEAPEEPKSEQPRRFTYPPTDPSPN